MGGEGKIVTVDGKDLTFEEVILKIRENLEEGEFSQVRYVDNRMSKYYLSTIPINLRMLSLPDPPTFQLPSYGYPREIPYRS